MVFYIGFLKFSLRKIVLYGSVGGPLLYWWSYRSRTKFMRKLREKDNLDLVSNTQAQAQYKDLQNDQFFRNIYTGAPVNFDHLVGQYKMLIFGDVATILRFQRDVQQKITTPNLDYYCILDKNNKEDIDKLKLQNISKDNLHFLETDRIQNEFYILNEENKVILYDQIQATEKYFDRISLFIKVQINKDIEKKFVESLKF